MSDEVAYFHAEPFELISLRDCSLSYPLHTHRSVYAFSYFFNGRIVLHHDQRHQSVTRGDHFVISPNQAHQISAVDPYSMLTICIKKHDAAEQSAEHLLREIRRLLRAMPIDDGQRQALNISLASTLRQIRRHSLREASHGENAFIRLTELIADRSAESFHSESLAERLYLSRYHFIRRFKAYAGLTPHQFQIQVRIRNAQRLLQTNRTLTDVAQATGFYDQSHFIRHFKARVGLIPTDYRAACQTLKFID